MRVFDFFENRFQPIFEFAAILCPSQHRAKIERHHALVLQHFGHIARDNALRQALDNCRLAHTRLADQYGIVLGTPGKHLNHAPNLLIAADHRIEFAATRLLGQVASVAFKRLILAFGVLVSDSLRPTHSGQRFQNCVVGRAVAVENVLGGILLELCRRQQ